VTEVRDYRGLQSVLRVAFPFSNVDGAQVGRSASIQIHQKFNTHDVALLTLPYFIMPSGSSRLAYGAPISVSYSAPSAVGVLNGYVHDYRPITGTKGKGTQVQIISTGLVLKTRRSRVFSNLTASNIVKRIADENGLRSDIEPHPRIFHQVAQAGCSDWELLVDLARRIGYSVRVEGVTLQFVSRATLARHYRAMAPTLTVNRDDFTRPLGLRDVLAFTPSVSDHQQTMTESLAQHVVTGMDLAGRPFEVMASKLASPGRVQGIPVQSQIHTVESAQSRVEAQQIAEGKAESNRYPVQAHAVLWGDPRVAPNRVIRLTGLGDGLSGYWTVLEAIHEVKSGPIYQMEVILGTESLGNEVLNPVPSTKTVVPTGGLLKMPYPDMRLTQGTNAVKGAVTFEGGPRWVPVN
jgi:phage protein D